MKENKIAEIIEKKVNNGMLIYANMEIGADRSGILISKLIEKSKKYNQIKIVDGSPGIGCPVIATLTDTDICLLVTEPSVSALSDLKRIYKLTLNFDLKVFVCINKYNINKQVSNQIENYCKDNNIEIIGKISYDDAVIDSINNLKPIVLYKNSAAANEIIDIANKLKKYIERKDVI